MTRTMRALMEYFYGGGGRGSGGLSRPIGTSRGMQIPYVMGAKEERDRLKAIQRRRARLGELAREWARPGELYGSGDKSVMSGKKKHHKKKKKKHKKKHKKKKHKKKKQHHKKHKRVG